MKELLTSAEKERIKKAVEEAEKRTSGEIVPYLVQRSDMYVEAIVKSSLFFVFATLIGNLIIYELPQFSRWITVPEVIISVFVSVFLGLGIGFLPVVRRFFAGKGLMEHRVRQRAYEAFLEREVFRTRNRTGVLIFISFLERRVFVLGDSGINQKVSRDDWQAVVNLVIEGIKNHDLVGGIEKAIAKCGELLEQSGLAITADDVNELSNEIIEREE